MHLEWIYTFLDIRQQADPPETHNVTKRDPRRERCVKCCVQLHHEQEQKTSITTESDRHLAQLLGYILYSFFTKAHRAQNC